MSSPKLRAVYLIGGFIGLFLLIFQTISSISDINPANILLISLPDMLLFYLAYRTYPVEAGLNSQA